MDQTRLAWLVTAVDVSDVPIARTFMVLDGSSWFAEITGGTVLQIERSGPKPFVPTGPFGPTAEPDAFASAPRTVAGVRVKGVTDAVRAARTIALSWPSVGGT